MARINDSIVWKGEKMHLYAIDELGVITTIKVSASYTLLEKHITAKKNIAVCLKKCYVPRRMSGHKQNAEIIFTNI